MSEGVIENKEEIKIDDNHTYIIGQYGPVIKCVENNNVSFKKIKEDIDFEKIRKGLYKIDEIVDDSKNRILGYIDNKPVTLKKGKYGLYFAHNDTSISATHINKEIHEITIEDYNFTKKSKEQNTNVIRIVDDNTSIRSGKYGDYIFYKTTKMKKPKFIKLNDFIKENGVNSYKTCNLELLQKWLKNVN